MWELKAIMYVQWNFNKFFLSTLPPRFLVVRFHRIAYLVNSIPHYRVIPSQNTLRWNKYKPIH